LAHRENDPGHETSLGDSQQQAQRIVAVRPTDQRRGRGDGSEYAQQCGQPPARAELQQQQVRGDAKERVGDEEQSRAQPEDRRGEAQICPHLQTGE
jgi:hypothetical protein